MTMRSHLNRRSVLATLAATALPAWAQAPAKKRANGQNYGPRVLVLAPTRELAQQVSRACSVYGHGVSGLRVAHVVGGVPYQAQIKALSAHAVRLH